MTYVLFCLGFD